MPTWLPWVLAHSAHVSCALSKVWQLASVDRLNVKMFVSSTNLTADVELVVSRRRNVDAKNRKRMGDKRGSLRDPSRDLPCLVTVSAECQERRLVT